MANRSTNILISEGLSGIAYVDRRGVGAEIGAGARFQAEAGRLADIKTGATPPDECGWLIPSAPGRGAFVTFMPTAMQQSSKGEWKAQPVGHCGRSAVRGADVFDRMNNHARNAGKPVPFTPGQVEIARYYRDLVEWRSAGGVRCSGATLVASGRGGDCARDFMDSFIDAGEALEAMRRRIGRDAAKQVRRVRPSARGESERGAILDRVLVDMVCIEQKLLTEVLRRHGWSTKGPHRDALRAALGAALDRMSGYRE